MGWGQQMTNKWTDIGEKPGLHPAIALKREGGGRGRTNSKACHRVAESKKPSNPVTFKLFIMRMFTNSQKLILKKFTRYFS